MGNKFNRLTKFQTAIIIGILGVILVAWIDLQGFNLLGEDYTNGNFPSTVWPHHLLTALIIFLIPAICYWVFYKKDKSEFTAIYWTGLILFYFGLADVFYFLLMGNPIPSVLPWLNGHIIIGNIAKAAGSEVTREVLLISVALGFILVYFITKKLEKI